jgi:hypothetical protein
MLAADDYFRLRLSDGMSVTILFEMITFLSMCRNVSA